MSIELNHTIVHVKDRWAAARDVGGVLGLPDAQAYGPFAELKLDNGASLDFMDTDGEVNGQHYAFLVGEDDFDQVLGWLKTDGRTWWADPYQRQPNEINHGDGGRGLYWEGPDGHWLEIITAATAAAADSRQRGTRTSSRPWTHCIRSSRPGPMESPSSWRGVSARRG